MGNPFLGVFFHWLGGLASGSFYVPYRGVKKWSWETYWLVGGFFSWIICPWLFASFMTNDLIGVLKQQSGSTLWWTYFFKQFMPSLPVGSSIQEIAGSLPGQVTLAGVGVCLLGIAIAAAAGFTKEKEMPADQKKKAIAEFNFKKGLMVATFSGIMSACFSFALTAGNPIGDASKAAGTTVIWTGLPKLCVVLAGGFTTNFIWCVLLNIKNRTGYQYCASHVKAEHAHHGGTGGSEHGEAAAAAAGIVADLKIPALANYLFSALAGTCWYFQFFFYTMGETQMGRYRFSSWTLHMASIIIFSTMWGWILHEWKGSSKKAHLLIAGGIGTLILSTMVIGFGTYLKSKQ